MSDPGTGWVIADILSAKTGHDFYYFAKDEKRPDDADDDSCIICPIEDSIFDDELFDKDDLRCVYEAALALGISKFGMTYHEELYIKDGRQEYDTNTFHYEFIDDNKYILDKEVIKKLYSDAKELLERISDLNEKHGSPSYISYEKQINVGRIERVAYHALHNKQDKRPTYEMIDYIKKMWDEIKD